MKSTRIPIIHSITTCRDKVSSSRVSMLASRPPVTRPMKTGFKPRRLYTIHSDPNKVFTLKPGEERRFSIVSFRNADDAILIGKMLQTYQMRQKELPTPETDGGLTLVHAPVDQEMINLHIRPWSFEELQVYCTRHIFDMISVENIDKKMKEKYTFGGSMYSFEAPLEFYQQTFEVLINST